jgi:MYXO-CTERM domain-containing protein|nr:choice-of-anchor D domain-containing protein [Kofleriaceae bacterium]
MKLGLALIVGTIIVVGARVAHADTVNASPSPVAIGSVDVGATGSATTTLSTGTLVGTFDLVPGAGCAAFSLSTLQVTLTLITTQQVTVTVTPTARGPATCAVSIVNDADGTTVEGSFTATADGLGALISAPASVDFGGVRVTTGATSTKNVTVTNGGDLDLAITNLALSGVDPGDFTVLTATPLDVPAGTSAQIAVTFHPGAANGRAATLAIDSDAVGTPELDVALTGTGTNASIDVEPTLLDFGAVSDSPTAQTSTKSLTINNDGPAPAGPLHVSTVTLTDPSGWFDFAASTGCSGQTVCSLSVDVTTSLPLPLTCKPDVDSLATNTASIVVASDSDTAGGNVAQLSCTGGRAQLGATPTTIAYGAVPVATTASQTVTVSNTGTTTLTYSLALAGAQAGQFALANGCTSGCTIAAGAAARTFDVHYTPTLPPAAAVASVQITTNSPDGPTEVDLTGTGTAAILAASPTTVAIGNVDVGGTGSATLTITNNGDVDLLITSAGLDGASSAELAVTAGSNTADIPAGASAQWTIACSPTVFGAAAGHFAIASNAFAAAATSIPVTCTGRQGVLTASAATVEFGGVRIGDTAPTQSITLTNTGNAQLTGLAQALADTTLGYTFTTAVPGTLAAGSATTVTFEFQPVDKTDGGSDVATFTAKSGTTPQSTVTAHVTVDGQALGADYDVDPTALAFGDVLWDDTAEQTVTIVQTDDPKITIETLDIAPDPTTGTQTGELTVTKVTHNGTALPLPFQPFQLQSKNDSLVVTITAAPANRLGTLAATLTVHSDLNTATPDRTVALTATSTAPTLQLTPGATVDFGGVDLAIGSAQQTVTIANTGTGPLALGTIVGSGSPTFTFTLPGSGEIAAGSSADIVVTYEPTLEEADTATLSVPLGDLFDDSPDLQTIVLQGHGIDRHISVPQVVSFPDTFAFPDSPPVLPVPVEDTGEAVLHLSMVTSSEQWSVLNSGSAFDVAGGSALQLMVEFAPAVVGKADGTLTIMDNDRNVPMAIVALHGNGIDRDVVFGPATIDMGTTGLGVPLHLFQLDQSGLQVTNMDAVNAFAIHAIDVAQGSNGSAFSLVTPPHDLSLPPSSTQSFDLVFDPQTEGQYSATLSLLLDKDPVPRTVTITGRAVFVDAHGGGGCEVGGGSGGGGGGALVLLGAALIARRRRRAIAAAVVASAAVASPTAADSTRNLDLSVFDPTPSTTGTGIQLQSPTVGAPNDYAIFALVSYARKPLDLDTGTDDFAIANRTTYDLGGAYAFLDRFEVGARIPLYTQSGDGLMPGVTSYGEKPAAGTARGDLVLHGKANFYRDDALAVGASVALALPTASDQEFAGASSPEAHVLALASIVAMPQLVLQVNLGAVIRGSTQFENIDQKSGFAWGAGASYRALDELWVTGEVYGETIPGGITDVPPAGQAMGASSTLSTIEALAGVRYQLADHTQVALAIGRGLDDGIGSPELRGVVGVTYVPSAHAVAPRHPPPPIVPDGDADGDGIPDSLDKCPNDPEDKDLYQDQDGCPDKDNDGDGIPDDQDKCPLDPEDKDGFQDADGCPDKDNDNDGVPDSIDKCPNDPEDKDGFEDLDGCPDLDNDNDGIPDDQDKCPNAPETINGFQDEDGCPDRGSPLVMVSADHIDTLDSVQFIGTKISSKSVNVLGQVASTMKAHKEIVKLRIGVHVQPTKDADKDLELTTKRAETVREFMLAKGVAAERLEVHGFGGTKPAEPPTKPGAAAINDRVEFVIVDRK